MKTLLPKTSFMLKYDKFQCPRGVANEMKTESETEQTGHSLIRQTESDIQLQGVQQPLENPELEEAEINDQGKTENMKEGYEEEGSLDVHEIVPETSV